MEASECVTLAGWTPSQRRPPQQSCEPCAEGCWHKSSPFPCQPTFASTLGGCQQKTAKTAAEGAVISKDKDMHEKVKWAASLVVRLSSKCSMVYINSLKRVTWDYMRDYYRGYEGDTRSLDCGSHGVISSRWRSSQVLWRFGFQVPSQEQSSIRPSLGSSYMPIIPLLGGGSS